MNYINVNKSILHKLLKSCVELCTQNFRHGRTVKDTEISMFKDILKVYLLTADRETSTFQSENKNSWEGGQAESEL